MAEGMITYFMSFLERPDRRFPQSHVVQVAPEDEESGLLIGLCQPIEYCGSPIERSIVEREEEVSLKP